MKYKLKPIPSNTVVHTPTEAEAKELLEILDRRYNEDSWKKHKDQLAFYVSAIIPTYANVEWYKMQKSYTILTFSEFKSKYCQEEPSNGAIGMTPPNYKLDVKPTEELNEDNFIKSLNRETTEKDKEISKAFQSGTIGKEMETKELNLVELLRGHEGESFFAPICGKDIELKSVYNTFVVFYLDKDDDCTIACDSKGHQQIGTVDDVGKFSTITYPNGSCMVFPSRALYEQYPLDPYTAWMKWADEQKKWGLQISFIGDDGWNGVETHLTFKSEEEYQKAIEEIKSIIEKYSK